MSRADGRAAGATLAGLFSGAVENNPDGIAVEAADAVLTYRELDRRSTLVARALIERGVGPEDLVAILLPRSAASVCALVGIAKSGAAAVPIDTVQPAQRARVMLADSGARVAITGGDLDDYAPFAGERLLLDDHLVPRPGESDERVAPFAGRERLSKLHTAHPAYLIYTSGSTGTPKGVVVTHRGLARFSAEQRRRYRVTRESRILHLASPSFDASILEFLLAVAAGARLVVSPSDVSSGPALHQVMRSGRITHAFVTPSVLTTLDPNGLDDLTVLIAGGEACPPRLVEDWAATIGCGRTRGVFDGYGPTETTIMSAISDPLAAGDQVTIGEALPGERIAIRDEALDEVPSGTIGELYISGVGLARGYHGRPAQTAARFVADPAGPPGARAYRTGDLAWRRGDDQIVYVGRNDHQVQLRGLRVELGEIDAVLSGHPAIAAAVTITAEPAPGDVVPISYVVPAGDAVLDVAEVRRAISQSLPRHMVPASIVVIPAIPLTPNGKIDRSALPDPVAPGAVSGRPPQTPTERAVADAFAVVLGIPAVGRDDDFFSLGGTSLSAVRVAATLGDTLGITVPVRAIFEGGSVAAFAAAIDTDARPAFADGDLSQRPEAIPLSAAQYRMWMINQLEGGSAAYNVAIAVRLTGVLDVGALRAAVGDLALRHEALRTVYPEQGGGAVQVVTDVLPTPQLRHTTAAGLPAEVRREVTRAFDVTVAPPIATAIIAVDPESTDATRPEHVLTLVAHHIGVDGWSLQVLRRDLLIAYAARVAGHPPVWTGPVGQPADHALAALDRDDRAGLEFWAATLADAPGDLGLPMDRLRPATQDRAAATVDLRLDPATAAALSSCARRNRTTLFVVLHAALSVALARLTGTDDVVVGTVTAGRDDPRMIDAVGMFVETIALRTRIDRGASFAEVLPAVREADVAALARADVPFEDVIARLDRSGSAESFLQVSLSVDDPTPETIDLPGLTVTPLAGGPVGAKFDLSFAFRAPAADGDEVLGVLTYATALFGEATARLIADLTAATVRALMARPDLPVGSIDLGFRGPRPQAVGPAAGTPTSLSDLLDGCAPPDRIALIAHGRTMTHRRWRERASALAAILLARGIGPEDVVAIAIPRSIEYLVAVRAITLVGAAFVPVDPSAPPERVGYLLADSDAALTLVVGATRDRIAPIAPVTVDIDEVPATAVEVRPVPVHPDSLAYLIYTSGSTGAPKAVAVTHRGLAANVAAHRARYAVPADGRVLAVASPGFDASIFELLLAISGGAALVITDEDAVAGAALEEVIDRGGVTHALITPAVLATIDPRAVPRLSTVIVGGERCANDLLQRWVLAGRTFCNAYGPTEATIWATGSERMSVDRPVDIGTPIDGVTAYVLDPTLRPVPTGAIGELYLSGATPARGYRGRPGSTAAAFVAHPSGRPGERMYRTGDLVRWDARGRRLHYLGRADSQVKLHGQRIELRSIDALLETHENVSTAVTVLRHDDSGRSALVSVVVPRDIGRRPDPAELRAHLARHLPAGQRPVAVDVVDRVPLTTSGKVDRRSLAAIPLTAGSGACHVPPRNDCERAIAGIVERLLSLTHVGIDDDLFDLGATSLTVFALRRELAAELDLPISARELFDHTTVRRIAEWTADRDPGSSGPTAVEDLIRDAELPLSIDPDARPAVSNDRVATVLLTGATGFLGLYLVEALLETTDAAVWCLVRGSDRADAAERLWAAARRRGIDLRKHHHRIRVIPGDLGAPGLGVDSGTFDLLAETVDVIYHCGARVNHIESYRQLRAANVLGTAEILRLAGTRRIKPVHHVSTGSAALGTMRPSSGVVREDERAPADAVVGNGYTASKWVAEELVDRAQRLGVPTCIHRPGLVSGSHRHPDNGADDSFWTLIRAAVLVGVAPEVGGFTVPLTPGDYVARSIVAIARRREAADPDAPRRFHLVPTVESDIEEILDRFRAHGFTIDHRSAEATGRALAAAADVPDADPTIVRAALLGPGYVVGPASGLRWDDRHVRELIGDDPGIPAAGVDSALIDAYVESFVEHGLLPRPQRRIRA